MMQRKVIVDVTPWDRPLFCFQLQMVIDNPALTDEGRRLMQEIGDYAQPSPNNQSR